MLSFPSMSSIEKMIYLKSSLRGQALSLIDNIPIDDMSFEQAWKLLEDEYYDKEFLIDAIMNKIIEYPKCSNIDNTLEFCTFLKFNLINLKKIGHDFEKIGSAGNLLISKIVRMKLPNFFIQELCRRSHVSYPSINQFLTNAHDIGIMFKKTDSHSSSNSHKNIGTPQSKQRVDSFEFRKYSDHKDNAQKAL